MKWLLTLQAQQRDGTYIYWMVMTEQHPVEYMAMVYEKDLHRSLERRVVLTHSIQAPCSGVQFERLAEKLKSL